VSLSNPSEPSRTEPKRSEDATALCPGRKRAKDVLLAQRSLSSRRCKPKRFPSTPDNIWLACLIAPAYPHDFNLVRRTGTQGWQ
jgi:hypothetical protein